MSEEERAKKIFDELIEIDFYKKNLTPENLSNIVFNLINGNENLVEIEPNYLNALVAIIPNSSSSDTMDKGKEFNNASSDESKEIYDNQSSNVSSNVYYEYEKTKENTNKYLTGENDAIQLVYSKIQEIKNCDYRKQVLQHFINYLNHKTINN